jgi:hypothetical protein
VSCSAPTATTPYSPTQCGGLRGQLGRDRNDGGRGDDYPFGQRSKAECDVQGVASTNDTHDADGIPPRAHNHRFAARLVDCPRRRDECIGAAAWCGSWCEMEST